MTQKSINYSKVAAILAGGALIAAIAAPAYLANTVETVENGLNESQIQEAMQKAIALQALEINVNDSSRTIAIYDDIFEEDSYEAYGEVLARDELDSRDFKKIIQEILNENDQNIESYRDIEDVRVKDISLDISGDDVFVEVEFKVDFFNDGDDDEDDIETAKFIVEFTVEDAANDDDDDREDAEVEDYDTSDFNLVKIYD